MFVELVNNHDAQKATVSSQKNVPVFAKKYDNTDNKRKQKVDKVCA